ncbi:hypothetical protein EJ04DRAFT_103246 [Polyplosphaeria fusca]|uniref:Uncharacterized protein n=1 Tax=Polyplosphaeria fusca TaxID=682080 RepID=A0A9P4V2M0_9PLEO|nr:hypothetical protein EJ04DRAFT_103246 [Polyplosphaeria fusca]
MRAHVGICLRCPALDHRGYDTYILRAYIPSVSVPLVSHPHPPRAGPAPSLIAASAWGPTRAAGNITRTLIIAAPGLSRLWGQKAGSRDACLWIDCLNLCELASQSAPQSTGDGALLCDARRSEPSPLFPRSPPIKGPMAHEAMKLSGLLVLG